MEEFTKLVDSMPKILLNIWGISTFDITSPIGYFGVLYSYLLVVVTIHSGMLGASIILKEERDKTAEFLMTKPVSRNNILTSKILAALTNVIIVNIVTFIIVTIVIKGYTTLPIAKYVIMSMIGMFFVQLLFMFIGICIAAVSKKSKKAGSITMFILLASFFISIVIDMSDSLNILRILTPFKYFDAKEFFINGYLNIWYIVLSIILVSGMLYMTYKKYNERDLSL
jgi:ABC-2 type transport system permease protein